MNTKLSIRQGSHFLDTQPQRTQSVVVVNKHLRRARAHYYHPEEHSFSKGLT